MESQLHAPRDTHTEIGRLLAHLEQKLAELDRLQHDIADDAQALAAAASTTTGLGAARSVFSVREAAAELGVSVSMVHKLMRQGLLRHLKVGARTLITAEHLERFRDSAEAQGSPEGEFASSATGVGPTASPGVEVGVR